jgi:hypothetical protein
MIGAIVIKIAEIHGVIGDCTGSAMDFERTSR